MSARTVTGLIDALVATGFVTREPHPGDRRATLITFTLVLPWPTVRIIVDVLGVYGLLWILGLLASLRVNPHVVASSGLRVRGNWGVDVTIPWDHNVTCRTRNRTLSGRDVQFDHTGPHVALSLGVMKQTHVDVVFRHPTTLELPSGETEPVRELRIGADEPAALVAAAQAWLAAGDRNVSPDVSVSPEISGQTAAI